MKKTIITLLFLAVTSVSFAQKSDNYIVDPAKSSVKWAGKKIVGGDTQGTIQIAKGNLTVSGKKVSGGSFVLDTKTIASETASARLVSHLKNEDFFDVEKFPTASFVITGIKEEKNGVTISGNMTIKGITKPISFPAAFVYGKDVIDAKAENVKIDRTQFGVQYNSGSFISGLGDKAIEDNIVLNISVRATKK